MMAKVALCMPKPSAASNKPIRVLLEYEVAPVTYTELVADVVTRGFRMPGVYLRIGGINNPTGTDCETIG